MVEQISLLWTRREQEVIDKKLNKMKLTQQDSNYLSRYVRPKLKEMSLIDSKSLLRRLEYNQKIKAIETKIKMLILKNLENVSSITLYGSVVYSDYTDFKDIDVLATVKKKFWKKLGEKYIKIAEIKKEAKKYGLNLHIQIYSDEAVYYSYPWNLSLIYQLKDSKTIYGILKHPSKIEIPKLEIRMKLDYSEIFEDEETTGLEIYKAIRNLWLVKLVIKGIIDNLELKEVIKKELGENLINRLKSNRCSETDKKIALLYLDKSLKDTLKEVNESKWEKIVL